MIQNKDCGSVKHTPILECDQRFNCFNQRSIIFYHKTIEGCYAVILENGYTAIAGIDLDDDEIIDVDWILKYFTTNISEITYKKRDINTLDFETTKKLYIHESLTDILNKKK